MQTHRVVPCRDSVLHYFTLCRADRRNLLDDGFGLTRWMSLKAALYHTLHKLFLNSSPDSSNALCSAYGSQCFTPCNDFQNSLMIPYKYCGHPPTETGLLCSKSNSWMSLRQSAVGLSSRSFCLLQVLLLYFVLLTAVVDRNCRWPCRLHVSTALIGSRYHRVTCLTYWY